VGKGLTALGKKILNPPLTARKNIGEKEETSFLEKNKNLHKPYYKF